MRIWRILEVQKLSKAQNDVFANPIPTSIIYQKDKKKKKKTPSIYELLNSNDFWCFIYWFAMWSFADCLNHQHWSFAGYPFHSTNRDQHIMGSYLNKSTCWQPFGQSFLVCKRKGPSFLHPFLLPFIAEALAETTHGLCLIDPHSWCISWSPWLVLSLMKSLWSIGSKPPQWHPKSEVYEPLLWESGSFSSRPHKSICIDCILNISGLESTVRRIFMLWSICHVPYQICQFSVINQQALHS